MEAQAAAAMDGTAMNAFPTTDLPVSAVGVTGVAPVMDVALPGAFDMFVSAPDRDRRQ